LKGTNEKSPFKMREIITIVVLIIKVLDINGKKGLNLVWSDSGGQKAECKTTL
jgi:hypothetical protein